MDQSLQALSRYRTAIKEFPRDVTILVGLGRVYEVEILFLSLFC